MYVLNNGASKYTKQKSELKREIDKSIITVGDVSIPLSVIDTSR